MKAYKAKEKLEYIVNIRHQITHTGNSCEELFIDGNFKYM